MNYSRSFDLVWKPVLSKEATEHEAVVGDPSSPGRVRFTLIHSASNKVIGPWLLMVEAQGCYFWNDGVRHYHVLECAKIEAAAIAAAIKEAYEDSYDIVK